MREESGGWPWVILSPPVGHAGERLTECEEAANVGDIATITVARDRRYFLVV